MTFQKIYKYAHSLFSMTRKEGAISICRVPKPFKEESKICSFCSKRIFLKRDNFVLLGTYNRVSKPDDEAFFHFQCFVEWYNNKVLEKSRNTVKMMQQKALGLFNSPMIQNVLAGTVGGDALRNMLNKDLSEESKVTFIKRVSDKIKDDRKQKRAKKRKTKMQ